MKKIYLLAAASLMAIGATAQTTLPAGASLLSTRQAAHYASGQFQSIKATPEAIAATSRKAPAYAGTDTPQMPLGYCGEPSTAYGLKSGGKTGMAIGLTAAMTELYAGNEIIAIEFAAGVDQSKSNPTTGTFVNSITDCTVFVSESLDGTPIVETAGKVSAKGFSWNTVTLSQPVTIEKGKTLYLGVKYDDLTPNDLMIVSDEKAAKNNMSGYAYGMFDGTAYSWLYAANDLGNLVVRGIVSGDNLPDNSAYVMDQLFPYSVKPNTPFQYLAYVQNEGATPISTVELTATIGTQAPQKYTATLLNPGNGEPKAAAYGEYGLVIAEFAVENEGNNIPVSMVLSQTNGNANTYPNATTKGSLLCVKNGYTHNVVCEELTSTRCSYCPIGITGLETMKKAYGANGLFIPIAVHANIPAPTDPMDICTTGAYVQFVEDITAAQGGAGAPASYFNRHFENNVYPHKSYLNDEFNQWINSEAMAGIAARLLPTDKEKYPDLEIQMTSAIDDDVNTYGFAYTIVEDNVGPYPQANGYSGASGNYDGWESQPSTVSVTFNDVARNMSQYTPLDESLFTNLVAGQSQVYKTNINMTRVKKMENASVVAMLVCKETGHIENACIIKSLQSGVESVSLDTESVVAVGLPGAIQLMREGAVYTIDGKLVAKGGKGLYNVAPGLYMVVTAGGNAKVIVK